MLSLFLVATFVWVVIGFEANYLALCLATVLILAPGLLVARWSAYVAFRVDLPSPPGYGIHLTAPNYVGLVWASQDRLEVEQWFGRILDLISERQDLLSGDEFKIVGHAVQVSTGDNAKMSQVALGRDLGALRSVLDLAQTVDFSDLSETEQDDLLGSLETIRHQVENPEQVTPDVEGALRRVAGRIEQLATGAAGSVLAVETWPRIQDLVRQLLG